MNGSIYGLIFAGAVVTSAFSGSAAVTQPTNASAKEASEGLAIPRYRLYVGQELRYEATYEFLYDESLTKGSSSLRPGDGHGDRTATSIWIVGRGDNGWRAVLSAESKDWRRRAGQSEEQAPHFELISFLIHDDGRISTDDPAADYFRIEDYFPRLPDDDTAVRDGWKSENPRLGRSYRYRRATDEGGDPDQWTFNISVADAMDPIVLASQSGRAAFDRERRLISLFKAEYTQQYAIVGRGVQIVRLVSVDRVDESRIAELSGDMRRLSEARRAESEAHRRAGKADSAEEVRRIWTESAAVLAAARKTIHADAFRAQIEALAASHDRRQRQDIAGAELRGKVLGAAAPGWLLKDLGGAEHSLADQRGKVVMLDFWYRGCGPCMQAMPQLKRLARQFAGRPVATFGVNTDKNHDDAAFVAEKLNIEFPTLLAGDDNLMRACGGAGFPTFIIIDQSGAIRYIHTGYTADLAERAAEVVEALLKQE